MLNFGNFLYYSGFFLRLFKTNFRNVALCHLVLFELLLNTWKLLLVELHNLGS